jgi:hypothetical protein
MSVRSHLHSVASPTSPLVPCRISVSSKGPLSPDPSPLRGMMFKCLVYFWGLEVFEYDFSSLSWNFSFLYAPDTFHHECHQPLAAWFVERILFSSIIGAPRSGTRGCLDRGLKTSWRFTVTPVVFSVPLGCDGGLPPRHHRSDCFFRTK